ncbi:hypothetical protein K2W90_00585 [Candidatus Babeliales bacterium]|nr:hypothetical protein [Candidatus Babeliales bacterium]
MNIYKTFSRTAALALLLLATTQTHTQGLAFAPQEASTFCDAILEKEYKQICDRQDMFKFTPIEGALCTNKTNAPVLYAMVKKYVQKLELHTTPKIYITKDDITNNTNVIKYGVDLIAINKKLMQAVTIEEMDALIALSCAFIKHSAQEQKDCFNFLKFLTPLGALTLDLHYLKNEGASYFFTVLPHMVSAGEWVCDTIMPPALLAIWTIAALSAFLVLKRNIKSGEKEINNATHALVENKQVFASLLGKIVALTPQQKSYWQTIKNFFSNSEDIQQHLLHIANIK